jgi:hypothetical protein
LKVIINKKLLTIILSLLIVLLTACTQPAAINIPEGTEVQREETYDDIVNCGPGSDNYRANCSPEQRALPGSVKETNVVLSDCIFAPSVKYRDNIETKSGEVRYNRFYIILQSTFLRIVSGYLCDSLTDNPIVDYELKLAQASPDFNIKNVGELCYGGYGCPYGDKQINLMIEIPADVEPGDYTLNFIVEANRRYCGELPCVIHVIE